MRTTRIELVSSGWKSEAQPIDQVRWCGRPDSNRIRWSGTPGHSPYTTPACLSWSSVRESNPLHRICSPPRRRPAHATIRIERGLAGTVGFEPTSFSVNSRARSPRLLRASGHASISFGTDDGSTTSPGCGMSFKLLSHVTPSWCGVGWAATLNLTFRARGRASQLILGRREVDLHQAACFCKGGCLIQSWMALIASPRVVYLPSPYFMASSAMRVWLGLVRGLRSSWS